MPEPLKTLWCANPLCLMRSSFSVACWLALLSGAASGQQPIPITDGEGLCRTILNSGQCAAAVEAHQIPLSRGRVRRDAVALHLGLTNGRELSVVHDTTSERPVYFFFLGICSSLGYYLLWAQPYEGHFIRLVNARTGWSTLIDDMPMVSPDGRRFATVALDREVHSNPELVVWRVDGDTLRREWRLVPTYWTPERVHWLSNRSLEFAHGEGVDTAEVDSTGIWTTRLGP